MALRITIYSPAKSNHQSQHAVAFKDGLMRHGIMAQIADPHSYKPSDLAVFWGHRQERIIAGQRSIGARYLVMERGYIGDRFKWTSLGFDGLNGRADFPHVPNDDSRLAAKYPDLLKPWQRPTAVKRDVVMGQVNGDAALAHVDIDRWYQEVGYKLRVAGGAAFFRPHPLSRQNAPSRYQVVHGSLDQVLAGAKRAITFNSNSAVDAVVNGVPAVAYDEGSMAWAVTSHEVDAPVYRPSDIDRIAWAARLSWCQWGINEIADGSAWGHLAPHAHAAPVVRVG